jgi:hypothetical protein
MTMIGLTTQGKLSLHGSRMSAGLSWSLYQWQVAPTAGCSVFVGMFSPQTSDYQPSVPPGAMVLRRVGTDSTSMQLSGVKKLCVGGLYTAESRAMWWEYAITLECVILEDELHGARFFKLQIFSNLKFQKNIEKIPERSQWINIPVYKFSSRNTMYSTLGKNNKIVDLCAWTVPLSKSFGFCQICLFCWA